MCFTNQICIFFNFLVSLSRLPASKIYWKTHIIAQNCVQNDQKLSAGVEEVGGGGKRGGMRHENWGEERHGCWGDRSPWPFWRHFYPIKVYLDWFWEDMYTLYTPRCYAPEGIYFYCKKSGKKPECLRLPQERHVAVNRAWTTVQPVMSFHFVILTSRASNTDHI